ncbi:MAG: NERD domain-containing protein [Chloroflexales bacterium]|nr:NERD domain-containing protein [Chloroflexales bacterium]
MAVQVWIGEKPEHPNERRAIMALANGLHQLEGLYLILANFSVGGRTVDLVIVKHDAIFIVELKHCDGRVIGSVNGPWFVEGRNGERKRLNPGRKNPYNQVISYFHALTNFLNEHRREFLSEQKSADLDFRTCKRVVVIAPSIQGDSEIELDWKVELKGLDELPSYLITERSSEIELTDEEMLAIPHLLHCTPWQEINTVLRGVVPDSGAMSDPLESITIVENAAAAGAVAPAGDATVAPGAPPPLAEAATPPATPAVSEADAQRLPPRGLYGRARQALGTNSGAFGAALAVLAAVLSLALLLRPVRLVSTPDQPAPLLEVAAVATGSTLGDGPGAPNGACRWADRQLVGKRYDPASRAWRSVAEGSRTAVSAPEVVVALEQVSTCDGRIKLTWSVQNNSDRPVEFPLRGDNIRVSDGLGNEYPIDDKASTPKAVLVAPGAQERGMAVASRPLSSSATSILVRLRDKPFGEASFVVALQP